MPNTTLSPVSDTNTKAVSPNGMPKNEAMVSLFAMATSTCALSKKACEVVDKAPITVATTTASRGLTTRVISGTAISEKPKPDKDWAKDANEIHPAIQRRSTSDTKTRRCSAVNPKKPAYGDLRLRLCAKDT